MGSYPEELLLVEGPDDKAKIHTWLAWKNPPGKQLYTAVIKRIFDSKSPHAAVFMQWFQKLFEVAAITKKAGDSLGEE